MSQYTVPKRKNPLDSSEGFGSSSSTAATNSHLPKFVTKVPWYLKQQEDTLDHHKSLKTKAQMISSSTELDKGSAGDVKTKFSPGACENCGATSHKRKDCLERPRKVLAKFSGERLASDDVVPDDVTERTSFESKRDRWRGFTSSSDVGAGAPPPTASAVGGGLKMTDEETFKMATTLRERSDVAKYLLHIDDESKYYDPKSRSLRDTAAGGFQKAKPEGKDSSEKLVWE